MMFLQKISARIAQIWAWIRNVFRPFGAQIEYLLAKLLRTDKTYSRSSSNAQVPQIKDTTEAATMPGQSDNTSQSSYDPYLGLPEIGHGMTGVIYRMGEGRVVKKPRQQQPGPDQDPHDTAYLNWINQERLENEIQVFKRLGNFEGIIPCFRTSSYGIELALAQGDLESYLETCPERDDAFKIKWIFSLIDTFLHVHSCKVFVDDIALRNILILDEQLKLADFGQSILLPLDADITSTTENDMNVQIEILHLGWIFYSIASWQVHKYYFFNPDNPDLRWPDSFPNVDDVLFGSIIQKCWDREYPSLHELKDEAYQLPAIH